MFLETCDARSVQEVGMTIDLLHPNQKRILTALRSATRILRMESHLTVVGSLGRYLSGQVPHVGDIDVAIERPLCERYWEFLEILSLHGIVSVYDVIVRPEYTWSPCRQRFAL